MYEKDKDDIDRIHASVLFECIAMRDRAYQLIQLNSLSYEEANNAISRYVCINLTRRLCKLYFFGRK